MKRWSIFGKLRLWHIVPNVAVRSSKLVQILMNQPICWLLIYLIVSHFYLHCHDWLVVLTYPKHISHLNLSCQVWLERHKMTSALKTETRLFLAHGHHFGSPPRRFMKLPTAGASMEPEYLEKMGTTTWLGFASGFKQKHTHTHIYIYMYIIVYTYTYLQM